MRVMVPPVVGSLKRLMVWVSPEAGGVRVVVTTILSEVRPRRKSDWVLSPSVRAPTVEVAGVAVVQLSSLSLVLHYCYPHYHWFSHHI